MIVSASMNNDGRTAWTNQGVIRRLQCELWCSHLNIRGSVGSHFNISQITGVESFGIFGSVLLGLWIEVLAGRLEVGLRAIPFFMIRLAVCPV